MKVKRKYCKPGQFILDEVDIVLLGASSYQPEVNAGEGGYGGGFDGGTSRLANPSDSTFVDDEDVEPEIWTGYKKYNGFE